MTDKVQYEAVPFEGKFKLTVEDKNGAQAVSDEFSFLMNKNSATLNITPANAFARSFRGVSLDVQTGKPEKYTLQYRLDGGSWTNAEGTVSGNTISYGKISGLAPDSEYEVRAIYNKNPYNSTDIVKVRTEADAQVGNNGFEDWTTETIKISVALASDRTLDWYLPYADAGSSWWAVTSKKSMPTSIMATTKTSVKSFPTVAYSPDCTSGTNPRTYILSMSADSTLTLSLPARHTRASCSSARLTIPETTRLTDTLSRAGLTNSLSNTSSPRKAARNSMSRWSSRMLMAMS